MKRVVLCFFLTTFAALFVPAVHAAAAAGTEAEAEALVKKVVAFYKKNGKEKTIVEVMKNPGPFVDRDLYVAIGSIQGVSLAHINPKFVGKSMVDLRDADGKYFVKERNEAALKQPNGWIEYKFYNPVTKKIEPKRVYWERHDDLVFHCGAYKAS